MSSSNHCIRKSWYDKNLQRNFKKLSIPSKHISVFKTHPSASAIKMHLHCR